MSSRQSFTALELNLTHLSVLMPVPEYLLAMKRMAARTGGSSRDMGGVKFLLRHLGLDGADSTLSSVEAYYPASQITT